MSENASIWWCPHCRQEVDPRCVTYREHHESCGHRVVSIEPGERFYTLADLEQARKQGAEDEKAPVLPGSRLAQCGQASEEKEDAPPLGRLPRGEGRWKMKAVSIFVVITILFVSCSHEPVKINNKEISPYGIFNMEEKIEGVKYRISMSSVIISAIGIKTVVLPIIFCGWYLWEPIPTEARQ